MEQKEKQAKFEEFKNKFNDDENFRKKAISDPTKTFFDFLGEPVPENVKLKIDKNADGNYQIMPVDASEINLSEEDLDKIAGGHNTCYPPWLPVGGLAR